MQLALQQTLSSLLTGSRCDLCGLADCLLAPASRTSGASREQSGDALASLADSTRIASELFFRRAERLALAGSLLAGYLYSVHSRSPSPRSPRKITRSKKISDCGQVARNNADCNRGLFFPDDGHLPHC